MEKRFLGNMETSAMGFGCMGLNYHRGPAKDRKEMISVIHSAIDAGVTLFDTAEVYGPYTNEELVGDALVGRREKVQIATKGGFKINGLKNKPDSRPETLRSGLEGSLKRLKTDYIDLYYIHRVDPHVPIEEVASMMQEFKKEGKIRYWGLSEASAETIRKAHNVEPLAAVENEYSMWWRKPEETIFSTLEELGIGLVAYSPLGRGFLTGKLKNQMISSKNDNRIELPRFQKDTMAANQVVIDFITQIAEEKQATPAQIALAWIMQQKPWIVPIPGTTKAERIQENLQAAKITFSSEERKQINQALANIKIYGDRYLESENKRIGN